MFDVEDRAGPQNSAPNSSRVMFPLADSTKRYRWFRAQLVKAGILKHDRESLIPTVEVDVSKDLPELMKTREDMTDAEMADLRYRLDTLAPWNYSIYLGRGMYTAAAHDCERMIFRAKLITHAVERFCDIRGATAIDMACNHGYLGLELAYRGAEVLGIDLREINIQKARLIAGHFRQKAEYRVQDAYDTKGEFDIVYNLGLLYHVTDHYKLILKTYQMARKVAVIDTLTHAAPVSALIVRTNKDIRRTSEGVYDVEYHPTYRAVIDQMHAAGFRAVYEVIPRPDPSAATHKRYADGLRRCFIGLK